MMLSLNKQQLSTINYLIRVSAYNNILVRGVVGVSPGVFMSGSSNLGLTSRTGGYSEGGVCNCIMSL